jgi:hypothetical protein
VFFVGFDFMGCVSFMVFLEVVENNSDDIFYIGRVLTFY